MAERNPKPTEWKRGFHPADQEINLNTLAANMELLLPDYPVLTKDLPAALVGTVGSELTFDITVASVERGTLTYQWQKWNAEATPSTWEDINGKTTVDLTIASYTADDAGKYRNVITNTHNGLTATTYTKECTVTTAE